jgi:TolB-like protein/Flp pilus assembly protein TadD
VLRALLNAQGQVVTKTELMAWAWPGAVVEESNLSVQIAALRKLLGSPPEGGEWIATVSRIGYRFVGPVSMQEAEANAPSSAPATDFAVKPSIAVLPFVNLSGDPEQDYFADGITEDIITALSRFRWFFVIARNSSFVFKGKPINVKQVAHELGVRYVLEGSVRKSGKRVRISAELIDAGSGNQIWGDRHDFELVEIFAVQDQIAQKVAGAIEPELLKTESRLAMTRPRSGNLTAWDLVRQGTYCFHKVTRETHLQARDLFRQASARDSELPDAQIWLARVSAGIVAYGWSNDPASDLREGLDAAFKAIRMEEKSPYSHYALAITSVYAGQLPQAIRAAERALELSPSFALGYLVLGMACLFAGEAFRAIEPFERGLRLNPYDPQNFVWYNLLAFACFFAGEPDKALQCAERAWDIRPSWRPALELMACCYVVLDDSEAARQSIEQVKRLQKPSDNILAPLKRENPDWTEKINALLRKAGWEAQEEG